MAQDAPSDAPAELELSIVMPCLDEAETLEGCIRDAQACIEANGLAAEIIVADNGSQDGSPEIARRCGARVVHVPRRGYGSALRGGFQAARGRYLLMGDADRSYDFGEAMRFVQKLREGADLVMGSRFRGRIEPGAMPWSHRWIGNPVLSWLGRALFHAPVSDFHCGLRALSREAWTQLGVRTSGMEFASELVVKAALQGLRIEEVPVTLRPDARSRPPHLRTFRDGWRHLRFLFTLSPRYALFVPGLLLAALGLGMGAPTLLGPTRIGRVTFDVHTLLAASLLLLVGTQAMTTAVAARIYAAEEELGPPAPWLRRALRVFTLERGLLLGALLVASGVGIIGSVAWHWASQDFGPLSLDVTLRPMIVGTTLVALGIQALLTSFLYSMLRIERVRGGEP